MHRAQTGLKCLARFDPVPPGTIDFHALNLASHQKVAVFEQQLKTGGSVYVLARVESLEGEGDATIDLGFEVPKVLSRKAHIPRSGRMGPDDCVVVELQRHTLTRIGVRRVADLPEAPPLDLKAKPQPLAWLHSHFRSGQTLRVRARIAKVHPLPDRAGEAICFFDLGFMCFVRGQARDPRCTYPGAVTSDEGKTCTIEITSVGSPSAPARSARVAFLSKCQSLPRVRSTERFQDFCFPNVSQTGEGVGGVL